MGRHNRRAYPDLNQGPADLQSAALTTELYTHVDKCKMLGYPNLRVVKLMVPRFARATASRPQLLKLVQHARWNLDDRVWLQVRSAFPELVGKRLGDVWVGLGCFLGLSLAARTSAGGPGSDSAERVEASDALAPRFAAGV